MRKVIQLRGLVVQHHLIIDGNDIHIIDGGFLGGISRIDATLSHLGKSLSDIRSIILTHGHLDHTLNVARLQKLTDCQVYAPRLDREHLQGSHRYRGWSRVCGWIETLGRIALRFEVPRVDQWFDEGESISGLEVIALPGHTIGHCGFLLAEEKLLLAGDLFTNHFGKPSMPPRILNDDQEEASQSIAKAAALELNGVFLNHTRKTTPQKDLENLQALQRSLSQS